MSSGPPHAPALDHDGGYFSSIHLCRHDTVTASVLDKSVHIEAAVRGRQLVADRSVVDGPLRCWSTPTTASCSCAREMKSPESTQSGRQRCEVRPMYKPLPRHIEWSSQSGAGKLARPIRRVVGTIGAHACPFLSGTSTSVWQARPIGPNTSRISVSVIPMPFENQRDAGRKPIHSPTGTRLK